MIVRFRRGNMAETRPVHGKLDHHVSAGRKRDGYKQLPVSVEFPKYGNTLFRPVIETDHFRQSLPLSFSGHILLLTCILFTADGTRFWTLGRLLTLLTAHNRISTE